MLTDSQLKSDIDALWNKMRDGGLPNPLDSIEQLSFLLFMKRLDEEETRREQQGKRKETPYNSLFVDKDGKPKPKYRWSQWTQRTGDDALQFVKTEVFPFIKQIGGKTSGFAQHMANAEFKINKPTLLQEACASLDQLKVSQQNQDVQGDVYEYMLGKLGDAAGRNGQFRTPRHIIRMMVQMIDPKATERICDPAAGTAGFLVNAYQYILEKHTNPASLEYDEQGFPHHLTGETLEPQEREFLQTRALSGFDNDSGMTMLRIGAMNLMLHGIKEPNFRYTDTLGKSFEEFKCYDVVLANPPFKGAIDSGDVNDTLPARCKKTELLFIHLFLRLLDMGGRCAAISPEGVLFGGSGAHVETRRKLIEENRLEAVISMPSGVFQTQRRLQFHREINRLTFENAIAPADDEATLGRLEADQDNLAALEAEIHPLQREFKQLSRHFWVTKSHVEANRYDLSASRYRLIEQDENYYDPPQATLSRMLKLEQVMALELKEVGELLK